ncbi:MAG: hypothetical protein ABIH66_09715 [bacterium]
MKRIAAPMVGGPFTALILTLILIPVIYSSIKERELDEIINSHVGNKEVAT